MNVMNENIVMRVGSVLLQLVIAGDGIIPCRLNESTESLHLERNEQQVTDM